MLQQTYRSPVCCGTVEISKIGHSISDSEEISKVRDVFFFSSNLPQVACHWLASGLERLERASANMF